MPSVSLYDQGVEKPSFLYLNINTPGSRKAKEGLEKGRFTTWKPYFTVGDPNMPGEPGILELPELIFKYHPLTTK